MNSSDIDKALNEMLQELEVAPKLYRPSMYWENLNFAHIQYIKKHGINYFKRSINREYFHWGVSEFRHQLSPIYSEIRRGNISPFINSKLIGENIKYTTNTDQFAKLVARFLKTSRLNFFTVTDHWLTSFNKLESATLLLYKIHVAYLYDYISRFDQSGLLKKLSEPNVGGPLLVRYRGSVISQDLCNSIQEFYSITQDINVDTRNLLDIAELGAGYGRLAYVFLKVLPNVNYAIIDIPPALYIAQEYLTKIFPNEIIFSFRRFNRFKEIEKEFRKSRIKFLMPHQIEYIPKDFFNIMINISSFHEMRRNQIKNYLQQADRLTKDYFYSKQWKKSKASDNNYIQEDQYPIPRRWKNIYHRRHPIQRLFFEALYKTRHENHTFMRGL